MGPQHCSLLKVSNVQPGSRITDLESKMFQRVFQCLESPKKSNSLSKQMDFVKNFSVRTLAVTLIVSSIDSLTAEVTWITPELTQVGYSE